MSYNCSISQIREPSGGSAKKVPSWLLKQLMEEKEARFIPQKFSSLSEFCAFFNLNLSRKGYWRLTDREVGHVNGLPMSWGHLVATNGILCYVETHTGLYLGHMAYWTPFVDLPEREEVKEKVERKLKWQELDELLSE